MRGKRTGHDAFKPILGVDEEAAEIAIQAFAKAVLLPTDPAARKAAPIARGVLDYFPRALIAVAELSYAATQQHHPGEEMHWDKTKSTDHADCLIRHLIDRGTKDTDGILHSVKVAWRALALLEIELEKAAK